MTSKQQRRRAETGGIAGGRSNCNEVEKIEVKKKFLFEQILMSEIRGIIKSEIL